MVSGESIVRSNFCHLPFHLGVEIRGPGNHFGEFLQALSGLDVDGVLHFAGTGQSLVLAQAQNQLEDPSQVLEVVGGQFGDAFAFVGAEQKPVGVFGDPAAPIPSKNRVGN